MDYGFVTEIKKFREKNINDNLKKNEEEIKKIPFLLINSFGAWA